MIRECFIREIDEGLIVGSGIAPSWFPAEGAVRFGPAPTPWGIISLEFELVAKGTARHKNPRAKHSSGAESLLRVSLPPKWFPDAPQIEVRVPGWGRKGVGEGREVR